jgi:hypothetical protein
MEQIRCDLADDVSHLSDDAKTLTDYRYYVRQHPWLSVAVVAAAGFVLIPRKTKQVAPDHAVLEELLKKNQLVVQTKSEANQKRGLIATGISLAAAAALRAAMGYAQQKAMAGLSNFGHGGFGSSGQSREQPAGQPASYPPQPR